MQRGNASILGLGLLSILSGLFILFIWNHEEDSKALKAHAELLLCMKRITGPMAVYTRRMEKLNEGIRLASNARWIALLFPELALASESAESIRRILQGLQVAAHTSYLNELRRARRDSCPIPLSPSLFPYETHAFVTFKRHVDGQAQRRNRPWTLTLHSPYSKLSVQAQIQERRLHVALPSSSLLAVMDSLKASPGRVF